MKQKGRFFLFILSLLVLSIFISGCNKKNIIDDNKLDNIQTKENLEQKLQNLEEQKHNLFLPQWVLDLNIQPPKGIKLIQKESYQTTEDIEGFNSIHYVYKGDYDLSMQQAQIIANKANIPVSPEFEMAQKMMQNMPKDNPDMQQLFDDLQGIVYTNYSLTDSTSNYKYLIAITVNEDGSLELDITDREKMEQVGKEYAK